MGDISQRDISLSQDSSQPQEAPVKVRKSPTLSGLRYEHKKEESQYKIFLDLNIECIGPSQDYKEVQANKKNSQ